MIAATAAASICVFLVAFWALRIVPASAGAVAIARDALGVMRDPALDDASREKAVQRASLRLLGTFFSILLRGAIAFGVSLLPIWLADAVGLASHHKVIAFLSRWDVILIASLLVGLGYLAGKRLWTSR